MNNNEMLAEKLDFTYKKEDSLSDARGILNICLSYWYVFAIAVAACLAASFFYLQRQPSLWNVASKIIVEDDKQSPTKALTNGINSDLASLFDVKSNADNEVKILRSNTLLRKVIRQMNLNIHLYDANHWGRQKEMYNNAPFTVQADSALVGKFNVKITGANTFNISDKAADEEANGSFGVPLKFNDQAITLQKTTHFSPSGTYKLQVESYKKAERELAAKFNVALDDKQATVIDLQLSYNDPKKGEQILQRLMQLYLQDNLVNKIRIADSTMKFIDNRLVVVGSELNKVEKNLEQYKVKNKISDISSQAKALVAGADEYQDKLNENQVQLDIVNSLYKYVNDANDPQVVPSSLMVKDPSFGAAINAYNEMLLRKEQLKLSLLETSPIIKNLDQQIDISRKALVNNLKNYRNGLLVSQSAFKKQNAVIAGNISEAPVKERVYLDYARQQSLKQELYLFLLQKREETAISQTATISSCRILDNAEADEDPYAPKTSVIYTMALFGGLLLAGAILCLKEIFNVKVSTKADIDKHTTVPLLGEISRNSTNTKKLLIHNDAHSVILEEIRALRTSLKYVTDKERSNVILFTSSMSGEGKSFLSLNLSNSIALSGKKVVLLELDLRKPKLLKNMGINNAFGFTNYVISENENDFDELIKPSVFNDNLSFISSGPIPPNPAELLMSDRLPHLISKLREQFDYVIIDTAPVGLVSDALLIEEYADITCYVVRQNYTYKSQLGIINDLQKTRKVKQLYLVVNDIELTKNSITGYGHGYGGYGYTMEVEQPGKLAGLLKRVRSSAN